jgi:hypothetical protein
MTRKRIIEHAIPHGKKTLCFYCKVTFVNRIKMLHKYVAFSFILIVNFYGKKLNLLSIGLLYAS